jgi:hypothetical protein
MRETISLKADVLASGFAKAWNVQSVDSTGLVTRLRTNCLLLNSALAEAKYLVGAWV